MLCAISGNETSDAVVSPKSGGIFDRKLALAYISTLGKDPLNDEPLVVDELIPISNAGIPVLAPPKPAEFHSIPTILQLFQNEWDALALEVFSLRKQLHGTRKELSIALYKYDAAVRVAAAATREKEAAQKALQQISETFASHAAENGGSKIVTEAPEEQQNAPTDFVLVISLARETLFTLHKQLKLSLPVTLKSEVFLTRKEEKLTVSGPQYLLVDAESGQHIITGASFGTLCLPWGVRTAQFVAVAFLNENGLAMPLGVSDKEVCALTKNENHDVVVGNILRIIPHPSEPFYVAITKDEKWVLAGKKGIVHASEPQGHIAAAGIHVDGALLGIARAGKVDIFDLTSFQVIHSMETAGLSAVSEIRFALNGYWLLVRGTTNDEASSIRIYDLRKNALVHAFDVSEETEFAIDPSCQMLVTCDAQKEKLSVHLYTKKGKKWTENVHVEDCGALHHLQIESSAEELRLTKTVKLVGLAGDSLVRYEIGLK